MTQPTDNGRAAPLPCLGGGAPMSRAMQAVRLLLLWGAGLMLTGLLCALIVGHDATTPRLRIATMVQDLLVFVVPAAGAAVLCSRLPADWLRLRQAPGAAAMLLGSLALITAIPAMNALIAWNEGWTLPAPLAGLMEQLEQQARQTTLAMTGTSGSAADLVMGLLIVGVMAGLSEELFFRGALLRVVSRQGRPGHTAIWLTAAIFSLFHLQIFGFVSRLLLGAWFGYLVRWSGSLWPAVTAHIVNNSAVVTALWLARRGVIAEGALDTFGADSPWLIFASATITFLVVAVVKICADRRKNLTFAQI